MFPLRKFRGVQETMVNRRTHAVALSQGERPPPEAVFPTVREKVSSHAAPELQSLWICQAPQVIQHVSEHGFLPPPTSSARSYFLCQRVQ